MFRSILTIAAFVSCLTEISRGAAADTPPLLAGVASADITPEPGLFLWGYSNRAGAATGALDPLTAKALVLKQGDKGAAIVALDLGRVPEDHLLERLRNDLQSRLGIDCLFVTASHTHSAPSLESIDGPNAYAEAVTAAIARIVEEAAGKLEPVTLGVGRGEADYAHNRRRYLPDGRVAMQWRNAERQPTDPVDKEYTVVRFNRADGKPLAVLLHYACHPVVLGPDNLQYSADYVGQARAIVEERLQTACLFLQGGCGNINPYMDKTPLNQGGVEQMQRMGKGLGHQVVDTAQRIETQSTPASLKCEVRVVPVRLRWDLSDPRVREVLSAKYGRRFDNYLSKVLAGDTIPAMLTTLLLDDQVALVGMPGEVFVDFQLDLKQRSPVRDTLLTGYTNGYHAYFPTIRDAAAGGYGGKTATYVAPGAGELLTNEALISVFKLLDRLHDLPREEDFDLLEWDAIK